MRFAVFLTYNEYMKKAKKVLCILLFCVGCVALSFGSAEVVRRLKDTKELADSKQTVQVETEHMSVSESMENEFQTPKPSTGEEPPLVSTENFVSSEDTSGNSKEPIPTPTPTPEPTEESADDEDTDNEEESDTTKEESGTEETEDGIKIHENEEFSGTETDRDEEESDTEI